VELLVEALNKYEGSFIMVSHDRYFISKAANKIWEIENHEIKSFDGGYEEWVQWKSRRSEAGSLKSEAGSLKSQEKESAKSAKSTESVIPKSNVQSAKPSPQSTQSRSLSAKSAIPSEIKKELQKQQKIFQQLEERVAQLNAQKASLEAALTAPETYADKGKFLKIEADYKKASDDLNQLNKDYEQVFEKLMDLEAKVNSAK